jgi:hypothetical protein
MTKGRGRRPAGGSANIGGVTYQSRVAAFYYVAVLGETEASPPLALPPSATLDFVRCESGQPVDDLLVGISTGGNIFAQVKRSIGLSPAATSPLRSVAEQFVRQYLSSRDSGDPPSAPMGPLDPARDRLALIVGPTSPRSLSESLATALDRVRILRESEPLDSAPSNDAEKRALRAFADHIRSAWSNVAGASPSDTELRSLLHLSYVVTMTVEGGTDEVMAKDRLRRTVLTNPAQADAAWKCLLSKASDMGKERAGLDRLALQRFLFDHEFAVKCPRSYEADLAALKELTTQSLDLLLPLAQIPLKGTAPLHIQRAASEHLMAAAKEQSVLVVGEPGAGKSGCLRDFCVNEQKNGHDVVLILVDRLEAGGTGQLCQEIGLDHELVDVLRSWPGSAPAYLVFDALDAARDERLSRKVRDAIAAILQSNSRWRVVASIREFDLRYSAELKSLFPGPAAAPSSASPEFAGVAHLKVPRLSATELAQVATASPELATLLEAAPKPLRELLHVPFNLKVAAQLVAEGTVSDTLNPIRSQLDLLDRYWQHRVLGKATARYEGERILRQVCEQMVSTRLLQVETLALGPSGPGLEELVRSNVLAEWQPIRAKQPNRYRLAFAHHVLFDYAVSRLLLRGHSDSLMGQLRDIEDFAVMARPSLVFHFSYLWQDDRDEFWRQMFALLTDRSAPKIAAIVAPTVLVDSVSRLSDLQPLLDASAASSEAVALSLGYVIGALLVGKVKIAGSTGPWCALTEALSTRLSDQTIPTVRILVAQATDAHQDLTSDQRVQILVAAAALLNATWRDHPDDDVDVGVALQALCHTFSGAPHIAEPLLRKAIEPKHLAERGHTELKWLARGIVSLFKDAPILTADIYAAAFSYREDSKEQTPLDNSHIMRLVSNRSQDYQHVLWQLAEVFPQFLQLEPSEAIRALLVALRVYLAQQGASAAADTFEPEMFHLCGRKAQYKPDHSAIWDAGLYRDHDDPVRMLNALGQYLREVSKAGDQAALDRSLTALLLHGGSAVVWRRFLDGAAEVGGLLADVAAELCSATPILVGLDTSDAAGRFLKKRFAERSADERTRIEDAILSIYRGPTEGQENQKTQARLLGCLSEQAILHSELLQRLKELQATGAVPPNTPPFQYTRMTGRPYTTEDFLRGEGVQVEEPQNRRFLDMIQALSAFSSQVGNARPEPSAVQRLLPDLKSMYAALSEETADIHPEVVSSAWAHLANACSTAARMPGISLKNDPGKTIRRLLLDATTGARPVLNLAMEESFEQTASWGSPATRIDAARGLAALVSTASGHDDEILQALKTLSLDAVAAVRFQVPEALLVLHATAPEFVWQTAARMASQETSRTVLQALIARTLAPLASARPDEVVRLVRQVLDRHAGKPHHDCTTTAIQLLAEMHLYDAHPDAAAFVSQTVERIAESPSEVRDLVLALREAITYGSDGPADTAVRQRGLDLMRWMLRASLVAFRGLQDSQGSIGATQWTESVRGLARAYVEIVVALSMELYVASGAFAMRTPVQPRQEPPPPAIRQRLYREASGLLGEFVQVEHVPAAYHIVETLESFIPDDPRGAFLRICTVVKRSAPRGYARDYLAAELVVGIIRRYLADYRSLLRDDIDCRRVLVEILDLFIDAGWPNARQLTYGLEDIFR